MKNEETLFLFAKAIKSLIKKQPLDKITVTDIVSTAGKTRQTFYRHFQDKYDLVNWYFEKLVLKSFEEMNQGGSLQEALNLKFAFIEQEHAFFKDSGRVEYVAATDDEAVEALLLLSKTEGILPAIESSHAIAEAVKRAPQLDKDKIIIINVSGRGDKDVAAIADYLEAKAAK